MRIVRPMGSCRGRLRQLRRGSQYRLANGSLTIADLRRCLAVARIEGTAARHRNAQFVVK
jgi:hypothetical protein